MAISYTRQHLADITDLAATAVAGGSLPVGTQYWFCVVGTNTTSGYSLRYYTKPSNIVTATTDAVNKTIDFTYTVPAGCLGLLFYWTTVDPSSDPEAFNTTGYCVCGSLYYSLSATGVYSWAATTQDYEWRYNDTLRFYALFPYSLDRFDISGSVTGDRATPAKLYAADVAGGWGKISRLWSQGFSVEGYIYLTSNDSYWEQKWSTVMCLGFRNIQGTSYTYLGTGTSPANGNYGSSLISFMSHSYYGTPPLMFDNLMAYNSLIDNYKQGYQSGSATKRFFIYLYGADFQIVNTTMQKMDTLIFDVTTNVGSLFQNNIIARSRYPLQIFGNIANTTFSDNIVIASTNHNFNADYMASEIVLRDLNEFGCGNPRFLITENYRPNPSKAKIVNHNLVWTSTTVRWYSASAPLGDDYVHQAFTFDAKVVDEKGNNLPNVVVVIKDKDGIERFNETTDANGEVSEDVITRRHWSTSSATNYGSFTDYNPMTVKFSRSGLETYVVTDFTLTNTARNFGVVKMRHSPFAGRDEMGGAFR